MPRLPRQAAAQALQPPCHPGLLGLCQIHPHICKHTPGLLGQRPNAANFPTSAHCPFPQLISHTRLLHTSPAPGPRHMLLPGLNKHLSPPSPLPLDYSTQRPILWEASLSPAQLSVVMLSLEALGRVETTSSVSVCCFRLGAP